MLGNYKPHITIRAIYYRKAFLDVGTQYICVFVYTFCDVTYKIQLAFFVKIYKKDKGIKNQQRSDFGDSGCDFYCRVNLFTCISGEVNL